MSATQERNTMNATIKNITIANEKATLTAELKYRYRAAQLSRVRISIETATRSEIIQVHNGRTTASQAELIAELFEVGIPHAEEILRAATHFKVY